MVKVSVRNAVGGISIIEDSFLVLAASTVVSVCLSLPYFC